MTLLVESGATKSDWCVVDGSGKLVSRHLFAGMNVSTIKMEHIKQVLSEGIAASGVCADDSFYMYIAGVVTEEIRNELQDFILSHYDNSYIRAMVETNFQRFIDRSLKCYDTERYPVGIVGGFGYASREIFSNLCRRNAVRIAGFLPEPIEGLIRYHSQSI